MRMNLASKDAKILHLKLRNQQLSSKGPGVAEALRAENIELEAKVTTLTDEVKGLIWK